MQQYIKTFKEYNEFSHLNQKESFNLELACYKRLGKYLNFPNVIDVDEKNLTIVFEHCGDTVRHIKNIKGNIDKRALDDIEKIVNALKKENIVHLDLKAKNPKNLCYKSPNIFLIDFDVAVIDEQPLNNQLSKLYQTWIRKGKYNKLRSELHLGIQGLIK